ncbi:MAG: hypothetical protein WAT65_06235, partial [Candidatus Nanopelagicales bacterium]
VGLLTRVVADAVAEGLMARAGASAAATDGEAVDEPMPEWEREVLVSGEVPKSDAAEAEAPAVTDEVVEVAAEAEVDSADADAAKVAEKTEDA